MSSSGPMRASEFLRADANLDGSIDLTDPVATLAYLFTGAAPFACPDAADIDDSGALDIADPVSTLGFLFQGGPPPASPFPARGTDPTPDGLSCLGEPDPDDRLSMEEMPEDAPDLAAAVEPPPGRFAEMQGDPLLVSAETFDSLARLGGGLSLREALGAEADRFREAFFAGVGPLPGAPVALAVDAVLPAKDGGCVRIPPELIDGGSRDTFSTGTFLRGDADDNGVVDEADAAVIWECVRGATPCRFDCWDSADANDDGDVDQRDVQSILLAALGEVVLPPPGAGGCGPDPTEDRLPACGTRCPPSRQGIHLAVEPVMVCGIGPHLVELIVVDLDGHEARAPAVVRLCPLDDEGCREGRQDPIAAGDAPTSPVRCRWVMARLEDPEELQSDLQQRSFDGGGNLIDSRSAPPLRAGGAMEVWRTDLGPGPDHALAGVRLGANCRTPPTELSLDGTGRVQLRLNVLCLDQEGVPLNCPGTVEVEGIYRSRVEAGTSAGPPCSSGENRVESTAQDEVSFQVNGSSVFAKGVAVQNGNSISQTPSYSLDLGIDAGPRGAASSARFRFGHSTTTVERTGRHQDTLDAFGNETVPIPLTLSLIAKGKIDILARQRTWARARSRMTLAGYWLVARTRCPAPPLFLSGISGEDGERALAEAMARDFRTTRLGH